MTLPSTPYLPVIFPDEAIAMNFVGYQPLRRAVANLATPYASHVGAGHDHDKWRDQQIQTLIDARFNNQHKDKLMRGLIPSSLTFTARETSSRKLNAMTGGLGYKRVDPAVLDAAKKRYNPTLAAKSGIQMFGGVALTNEGRKLIDERLAQRRAQYGVLETAAFDTPAPPGSSVLPPLTPEATAAYDDAMINLADTIQTGYVDRGLLDQLAKANSALIAVGSQLASEQISDYIDQLTYMTTSVEGIIATATTRGAESAGYSTLSKKILETLLLGLRRQYQILETLNRKMYEPVSVKQQLLNMQQGRKLPTEIENIERVGPYRVASAAAAAAAGRRALGRTWLARLSTGALPNAFAPTPVGAPRLAPGPGR